MRHRAAEIIAAYALAHFVATGEMKGGAIPTELDRVGLMIGAAFAANCTSSLEQYLAAAKKVGVADDDVSQIYKLRRTECNGADSV